MKEYSLSHLQELEAESIHIIREVAAEFENPVMLYSIGKDSSVMVRLAEKAFAPGKVPFPLMHIDSKWKFREMIEFRDSYAKEHGWNLIVESNMEAFRQGVGPFTHGSKVHTDLMKTKALLDALNKYKFDAAFGGARRDEEKSRAKERIFSWFFKGMKQDTFDGLCRRFASDSRHLLRPDTTAVLEQAKARGAEILIVSASIDNWVQPFFPSVTVLGTQIEVANGLLTGRFLTPNCYGQEKVRRILALHPDRSSYHLTAYGDSRGDRELLAFADEAHQV